MRNKEMKSVLSTLMSKFVCNQWTATVLHTGQCSTARLHNSVLSRRCRCLPLRTVGADDTARTVVPRTLLLTSVYETAMLPAFSQLLLVGAANHI